MTTATAASRRSPRFRSPLRDGATVAAVIYLAWVWQFVMATGSHVDVEAYWRAAGSDPYAISHAGDASAFLYAPIVAQLLAPFAALPFEVLVGVVLTASMLAAVYLVGPIWTAVALLTPIPLVWQDLSSGNIHLLLAAATVAGLRHPTAWAAVLLTKVTPGIGLLWFLARREWRPLAIVGITTSVMALLSAIVAPHLWAEWVSVLIANAERTPAGLFVPVPLVIRLPLAAAVVWWGAVHGHAWTVPLAAFLALPVIWIYDGFAMLLGVAGVLRRQRVRDTGVAGG